MSRIIVIGECRVEVACGDAFGPAQTRPAGLMAEVALRLAAGGHEVVFLSEVANDRVGSAIVEYLSSRGVDTSYMDCYTDGATPLRVTIDGGGPTLYTSYPPTDGFDIIWPRIDEDEDIVVYGGYMTLSRRWSRNYVNFMNHVVAKGCHTLYIPGDISWREPRATKVMPQVFENLERAGAVLLDPSACRYYFGTADPARALADTVEYYCRSILFRADDGALQQYGAPVDGAVLAVGREL